MSSRTNNWYNYVVTIANSWDSFMLGKNSGQVDVFNRMIFEKLVPKDHLLVQSKQIMSFIKRGSIKPWIIKERLRL